MTNLRERALSLRYNLVPDHLIGEILTKRWADNAIPFLALIATVAVFGYFIPGFFKPQSLGDSTRQLGEFAIVVTGMTVVMLGGGIDLSVGSIFALATFAAVPPSSFSTGRSGWRLRGPGYRRSIRGINGYLVGYLRLRAFLTTLVTFIIGRALFDILVVDFAARIQLSASTPPIYGISLATERSIGLSVSVLWPQRWRSSPILRSPARGPVGMCSRSGDRDDRPTIPASRSERPSS